MSESLVCWKCGAALTGMLLPLSRREECPNCNADQHVCRLCRHYDVRVAGQCREDRAETVTDKERANFCDYFEPQGGAFQASSAASDQEAREQLAELFGDKPSPPDDTGLSDKERARMELEKLFGGSD